MPYVVKLTDGQWVRRGKPVVRLSNASIYPHPSAAKIVLAKFPGAQLIPFSDVREQWLLARQSR